MCPEGGEEVEIPPKEKEKGKYDEDDEENVALEDLIGEDEEVEKIISNGFPLADVNAASEQAEWANRETPVTRAVLVP